MVYEFKDILKNYLPEPNSIWVYTIKKEKKKLATQDLFGLKVGSGKRNCSNMVFLYNKFYNNQKIILTRKEQKMRNMIISHNGSL